MSVARTDSAIVKISDETAIAEGITDILPSQATIAKRPTWRQSELDAAADFSDYAAQKSSIKRANGTIEECPYGTVGSVRPDLYKSGYSIDVKNYNITTSTGRSNLANNVYSQYVKRLENLSTGTQQTVIVDVRGQAVTDSMIDELVSLINSKTGGNVQIRFMK